MAKTNPFRFSTKYQDDETDLRYYGYRYYNASTGRWLSRDPITERGGKNVYGFVANCPVGRVDKDGRLIFFPPRPPRCLVNCAQFPAAGQIAKDTFVDLLKKYTCTCNGKQVSMADYDGCETGERAFTWQVAHRIWGCYAKKMGVPRACMLMGNIAWELVEGSPFVHEWTKHGSLRGYLRDTVVDMAAVIEGYDSGTSDCDHAFIPDGCKLTDSSAK
jgi:RHS repeat-associated protein